MISILILLYILIRQSFHVQLIVSKDFCKTSVTVITGKSCVDDISVNYVIAGGDSRVATTSKRCRRECEST